MGLELRPVAVGLGRHGDQGGAPVERALEAAGRTLWDFPEAPWEFKMNMARQCWDETRHVQIYEKLLDRAGLIERPEPEPTDESDE